MSISQLLEALKDPSASISIGEKLLAGICVAILAMAVVFLVLVIIAFIIKILQNDKSKKIALENNTNQVKEIPINNENNNNMEELVSVITASIAASTGNSANNIVVRKIKRTNNNKSSWERMIKNNSK